MCLLHFPPKVYEKSFSFQRLTALSTISETYKLFICKAQGTRLSTLFARSPYSAMEHEQLGFHLSSGFFTQNTGTLSLSLQYIGCPFSADMVYKKYPVSVVFCTWHCKVLCRRLFCALKQDVTAFSVVFWTWNRLELCSHPADHFHHHSETAKHNSACQLLF
jgi:hypothetical protein